MTSAETGPHAARDAERRRRRQELLAQRQMTVTWRNRLLARRLKYIRAHRDLARHLAALNGTVPPERSPGG